MAKAIAQKPASVKPPMWIPVFLKSIGAPVTQSNAAFLASWWRWEGGALTNKAHFNWLNTSHGNYPAMNSSGIKVFPNFQTGIKVLRDTMLQGYPGLVSGLRSGKVSVNDPAVQGDLNRWLTGNRTPGMTPYIQKIASTLSDQGPFPASGGQTPNQGPASRQKASGGVTEASSPSLIAPQLSPLQGFSNIATPVKQMPGIPKIGTVTLVQGPTKDGSQAPPLKVQHDPGVKSDARTNEIVDFARHYLGTKYVFGGTTPQGFDCSGFVQWVYGHMGVQLPRTTFEQVHSGVAVSRNKLKPGDILFFNTENDPRGPSHEGLYIGNGKFIQAPHTGDVVKISNINDPYYKSVFVTARRVK
jgi:cell wall-associated NlpC family hydrolase